MGFNEKVRDFRQNLTQLANDALQGGIPVSVVSLAFEVITHDLAKATEGAIQSEQQAEYKRMMEEQQQQAEAAEVDD